MRLTNFTPEGVEDIHDIQYEVMEKLQSSVVEVFRSCGFKQISTPTFEYYDLFSGIDMSIDKDQMYKIVDANGKLLVLRPDATIPIARMVASNYDKRKEELKYMYVTNVYRSADFHNGQKREFTQAGIEFFGSSSSTADSQLIQVAIQSLLACGFHDIKVDLGDTNYFNGLLEALDESMPQEDDVMAQKGLGKEIKKRIKALVESKNQPGLRDLLEELQLKKQLKDTLLALPFLFGKLDDTLEQAMNLALNETMRDAVLNVKEISRHLPEKEHLSVDMSLVNHLDYYTGMIFSVYLQDSGVLAGSGGRYDGLMKKFGKQIPATGFGINMDVVYEAYMKRQEDCTVPTGTLPVVNIALGKGRLSDITIEKLAEIGIRFPDYNKSSRKLIFEDETGMIRIVFVKAGDVDIYVEKGACDMGVAGKDTLMESNSDIFELLDLGYGKCRFAVAALKNFQRNSQRKIRVATKYPNVAKDYFEKQGRAIEIIKINGSVELAPIMGLADVIVDIVETGTTLKENGLEVIEQISAVSARLIVNRVSLKTKQDAILQIMRALEQ